MWLLRHLFATLAGISISKGDSFPPFLHTCVLCWKQTASLVLELGWAVEFEFLAHPISDKGEGGVYPRDLLWQSPSQCALLSMKLPLVNSNFNSSASTTTFEGAEEREGGRVTKTLLRTYTHGRREEKDSRSALAFYGLSFQYANERNGRKRKRVCDAAAAATVEHFCVLVSWTYGRGGGHAVWKLSELRGRLQKRRTPLHNPFSFSRGGGSRLEAPISHSRTHARSLNGAPFVGVGSPPSLPARAHFLSPFFSSPGCW